MQSEELTYPEQLVQLVCTEDNDNDNKQKCEIARSKLALTNINKQMFSACNLAKHFTAIS